MDLQLLQPNSANHPQFPSVESYATSFAKQLKPAASIVIDGVPLVPVPPSNDARLEFQKKWLACPSTQHQMTSFDTHLIPGTGLYTVIANGKVRFDESGRSRLGETADLVAPAQPSTRFLNGPWYGFNLNMVVDQAVSANDESEVISSFNYRVTFKPHDSVVCL